MGRYNKINKNKYIGSKIGNLEILRIAENKNNVIVRCEVCARDSELFGNGEFEIYFHNLLNGIIPCGCAKSPWWTPEQSLIRLKRRLNDFPNLEIIDFNYSKIKKTESRPILRCKKHDIHIESASLHLIMNKRYRGFCPQCEKESTSSRKTTPVEEYTKLLGKYPANSFVIRSDENKPLGKCGEKTGKYLIYNCGKCSNDKFVQAGLCDGLFRTLTTSIVKGHAPCRCSNKFRYSDAQIKYLAEEWLSENNISTTEFVGVYVPKFSKDRFLVFCCEKHGYYRKALQNKNFKTTFIHCPNCSEYGGYDSSKKGYFYVITASGVNSFIGFGISNIPRRRLRTHVNSLKISNTVIKHLVIFEGRGKHVLSLESSVKRDFRINSQDIEGFRQEALYSEDMQQLLETLEKELDKVFEGSYDDFIVNFKEV